MAVTNSQFTYFNIFVNHNGLFAVCSYEALFIYK